MVSGAEHVLLDASSKPLRLAEPLPFSPADTRPSHRLDVVLDHPEQARAAELRVFVAFFQYTTLRVRVNGVFDVWLYDYPVRSRRNPDSPLCQRIPVEALVHGANTVELAFDALLGSTSDEVLKVRRVVLCLQPGSSR